jgi:hypothetical protein
MILYGLVAERSVETSPQRATAAAATALMSPEDAETLSLSQLKYNFQQRMNEAIRQQRERMRLLLNDVDSVSTCSFLLHYHYHVVSDALPLFHACQLYAHLFRLSVPCVIAFSALCNCYGISMRTRMGVDAIFRSK